MVETPTPIPNLQSHIKRVETTVEDMKVRMESLDTTLQHLEEEYIKLSDRINLLESQLSSLPLPSPATPYTSPMFEAPIASPLIKASFPSKPKIFIKATKVTPNVPFNPSSIIPSRRARRVNPEILQFI